MFSSNGISRLMDKVISQHMVAGCSSSGKLANLVLANAEAEAEAPSLIIQLSFLPLLPHTKLKSC